MQPNWTDQFNLEWILAVTKSSFGLDLLFTQKVDVNPMDHNER